MPSAKQIAWRKKFAKLYGKKKKGSKSTKTTGKKKETAKAMRQERQPKAVDPKDYGTSKDTHQIPQGMLDELLQSKVRGFPFFAYTGIKDYLLMGNDSLLLKPIPPNPTGITAIQINYNKGADGFTMVFFVGNNRVANPEILYVGDLAENIVQKMGIG